MTQSKRIFNLLYQETYIFKDCSVKELEEIQTLLKIVSFNQGEKIITRDEPIDMFGMLLYGEIRAGEEASLTPE